MNVTNVLLFGIAVILFGGFVTLSQAVAFSGSPFESTGYQILIVGLGICILGPIAERTVRDSGTG